MKLYELFRHVANIPRRAMSAHTPTTPTKVKLHKPPVKAIKPVKPRHKRQRTHF